MRKGLLVLLVLALVFALAAPAMARRCRSRVDADTQYDPQFELGAGLDLVVYENDEGGLPPEAVTVEGKWDFANENGGVYLVATYSLPDLLGDGGTE